MSAPLPPVPNATMFDDKGQMVPTWRGFFEKWRSVLNPIYDAVQAQAGSISDLDSLLGSVKPMPDGDIVGTTDVQTVTNKTISDSVIDASNDVTLGPGTLIDRPDMRWTSTTVALVPNVDDSNNPEYTLTEEEYRSNFIYVTTLGASPPLVNRIYLPQIENAVYWIANTEANPLRIRYIGETSAGLLLAANKSAYVKYNGSAYEFVMDAVGYTL